MYKVRWERVCVGVGWGWGAVRDSITTYCPDHVVRVVLMHKGKPSKKAAAAGMVLTCWVGHTQAGTTVWKCQ